MPEDVKGRRLQEIIDTQRIASSKRLATYVGQEHEVLIEGVSKRSAEHMYGRNSQNSIVIVPRSSRQLAVGSWQTGTEGSERTGQDPLGSSDQKTTELLPGDMVRVRIVSSTAGSLKGEIVEYNGALVNA